MKIYTGFLEKDDAKRVSFIGKKNTAQNGEGAKMQITLKWLKEKGACRKGIEWFNKQLKTDYKDVLKELMVQDKSQWANWTISRLFTHKQAVQYALYAALQVIKIFEKKYPKDKRPRNAINSVKKWLKDPSEKNKKAADAAAYAAYAAAYAAADAAHAADAAAYAADAAAHAADAAADAAYAADAAAHAAHAAAAKKILRYGLRILK